MKLKKKIKIIMINKKSIKENKKINSELINMDLVKKLKAKEEECKKHQEIINNLLSMRKNQVLNFI